MVGPVGDQGGQEAGAIAVNAEHGCEELCCWAACIGPRQRCATKRTRGRPQSHKRVAIGSPRFDPWRVVVAGSLAVVTTWCAWRSQSPRAHHERRRTSPAPSGLHLQKTTATLLAHFRDRGGREMTARDEGMVQAPICTDLSQTPIHAPGRHASNPWVPIESTEAVSPTGRWGKERTRGFTAWLPHCRRKANL